MRKRLCLIIMLAFIFTSHASALPQMPEIKAKSAALYDINGQMIYEMNADTPLQPASVTKIMTMLLAMEAIERGEVSLDTMITGSAHAESMGGTQIWLKQGEQLTLDEMLKAIAIGSANDCAVAVAEHLAGTEQAFVEKMNKRAKELGCTSTTFVNANGLDTGTQKTLTSARDLALISVELLKHPQVIKYTSTWMDSVRNGQFALANTNKMLKTYDGMIGLKTGYISEAGYCISAAATRNEMTFIAVVMGAKTKEDRISAVKTLLDYAFTNYMLYTPDIKKALEPLKVELGKSEFVNVRTKGLGAVIIPKESEGNITLEVNREDKLSAPVKKGQNVGYATLREGTHTLAKIELIATENVEKMNFLDVYNEFMKFVLMKKS